MRRCASCLAEPGEYHLPSCECGERDVVGRFLPLSGLQPFPGAPPVDSRASMEDVLHGGADDEGDER